MRKFITALLFLSILFSKAYASPKFFEGRISPANNEEYKDTVLTLLKKSTKSIYIIMFHASYYDDPRYRDTSPTNLLIRELMAAKKRGVTVELILNQSNSDYDSHAAGENLKTGALLANNGIAVYLDLPAKNTHAKLLIIDRRFVIIGSANWSYSAMAKNNETNVVIDSPELAEYYTRYFEDMKKECRAFLSPSSSP